MFTAERTRKFLVNGQLYCMRPGNNQELQSDLFKKWGGKSGPIQLPRTLESANLQKRLESISINLPPLKPQNSIKSAIRSVIQAVTPVIASLKIPDIKPALILISNAFSSITEQVGALITSAITEIQKVVTNDFVNVAPQVACIVAEGNSAIKCTIVNHFNTIFKIVTTEISAITEQEAETTDKGISEERRLLIFQILQRLADVEATIEKTVSNGLAGVLSELITALTTANNDVVVQLNDLIADPENTIAILPQLVFADPEAIASILTSDSNALFESIQLLLLDALRDIDALIDEAASNVLKSEGEQRMNTNNAMVTIINDAVNEAIKCIEENIKTITNYQVELIRVLVKCSSNGLEVDVSNIIKGIIGDVEVIVEAETKLLIAQLIEMMRVNNQDVIDQVDTIVATTH